MNKYDFLSFLPAILIFLGLYIYFIIKGAYLEMLGVSLLIIIFLLAILWSKYWINKKYEKEKKEECY